MKPILFALLPLIAAACVPSDPLVSDYNGASVKIVMTNLAGEGARSSVTDAEALRICTKGGKRSAEYASSRVYSDYQLEHLYLCL